MNNGEDSCIKIDFYTGAYGPTIIILIDSLKCLNHVKGIFESLALNQQDAVEFLARDMMQISGLASLHCERVSSKHILSKTLQIVGYHQDMPEFVWSDSVEGWEERMWLIDSMVKDDKASHQYLTDEGLDDALVKVSYKEQMVRSRW